MPVPGGWLQFSASLRTGGLPLPGTGVLLQRRSAATGNRWRTDVSGATNAGGTVSVQTYADETARFRFRFPGDRYRQASNSPPLRVTLDATS